MTTWRIVLLSLISGIATTTEAFTSNLYVSGGTEVRIKDTKVYGSVTVESTGRIEIEEVNTGVIEDLEKGGFLEVVATAIEIAQGGKVDTSAAHFYGPPQAEPVDNHGGIGGSYGGRGGAPTADLQLPTRGALEDPLVERGSYGGDGPDHWRVGSAGGGSLIIRGERVSIQGDVICNGEKGEDFSNNPLDGPDPEILFGAGGGSGGGILIIAKHLTIGPNARITANGGDGGDGLGSMSCREGFPGGGGRIKIFYQDGTISEQGVIETKKGKRPDELEGCGGDGGAEDGTVYIEQVKSVDTLLNPGDLNNDGKTDYKDLLIVQQNWGKVVTPIPTAEPTSTPIPDPTTTPIPEPTSTPEKPSK